MKKFIVKVLIFLTLKIVEIVVLLAAVISGALLARYTLWLGVFFVSLVLTAIMFGLVWVNWRMAGGISDWFHRPKVKKGKLK